MITRIHAIAGSVALLMVLSFWISTLVSELFLTPQAVAAVKQAIVYGLALLVPAMIATGGSGAALARGHSGAGITRKRKRMQVIAFNGFVVMIPAALYLNAKAAAAEFDTAFWSVQAVELAFGAVQLLLIGRNFRDGLRLTRRTQASVPESS